MVGVGLRGFWRWICIRRAECLCAFQEKEWGARTVRQGLTRMQGYIARGRCKNFIRGGSCPLGLPRVSNLLKPSIICAARGRHRQRAMQKFYPRRVLPPRAPPRHKYLETIYYLRCKGKALPKAMQKFYPRRALPPRAPPCLKSLETICHLRCKGKA